MIFDFKTDTEGKAFCTDIVLQMQAIFSIDEQDALGRINQVWKNQDILGEYSLVYHETAKYWAEEIYEIASDLNLYPASST